MTFCYILRCGWLALAVAAFTCVEVIIVTEWCILTPIHNVTVGVFVGNASVPRCEKNEYDIALSLIYNAVLLLLFVISSIVSLCKPEHNITMSKVRK